MPSCTAPHSLLLVCEVVAAGHSQSESESQLVLFFTLLPLIIRPWTLQIQVVLCVLHSVGDFDFLAEKLCPMCCVFGERFASLVIVYSVCLAAEVDF